jgi:uncharacterized protein (UPF0147 family)
MDAFDRLDAKTNSVKKKHVTNNGKGDAFDRLTENDESFVKSALRSALQAPQGYLEMTPYGLATSGLQLLGMGEALDPEEIEQLKYIQSPRNPLSNIGGEQLPEFDEEKYLQAVEQASKSVPTIANIGSLIEEKTGLPLEPKTTTQKALRFAGGGARLAPQGGRLGGAVATGGTKLALDAVGAPEFISDTAAFLIGARQGNVSAYKSLQKRQGYLEQIVNDPNIPKSSESYQLAQEALNYIKSQEPPLKEPILPKTERPQLTGQTRTVQPTTSNIQFRPIAPARENPALIDRVSTTISPNRFRNTTQGGQAQVNTINEADNLVYDVVNELYDTSRELNETINETHETLVNRLNNRIRQLEEIPEPSDVQRRVIRSARNIRDRLATVDQDGNVTGYRPISNQVLIDQIQSLRQIIDFDFAHGNTKNIFRPLISDLQTAAIEAAENSGNAAAADALREAQTAYRNWAETFDSDYIRPYRDRSNKDLSKLYKKSLDIDEAQQIQNVLRVMPGGQELIAAHNVDIIEKFLGKYLENPRKINMREFEATIRELEPIIPQQQLADIRQMVLEEQRKPLSRIRAKVQPSEKAAAKQSEMSVEQLRRKLNTREGLQELKAQLDPKIYDKLARDKIRQILQEGKVEGKVTGEKLYDVLNNERNFEIISEIYGDEVAEAARQEAQALGKKEVRLNAMQSLGKKSAKALGYGLLYDLATSYIRR